MTAHNTAKKDEIAKVVIMPGDPLRAEWIAKTFLKNYKLVNKVRGMLAFTGFYEGFKVTIMGHGMGIPSIGIYSHELFAQELYDVDAIIRIGSAGSWHSNLDLGSIIIANEAISFSTYAKFIGLGENDTFQASPKLLKIVEANNLELNLHGVTGKVYSSDVFYGVSTIEESIKMTNNALAAEMEIYALYANAKRNNKEAIGIVTISDSLISKKEMSPQVRETGFQKMVILALKSAVDYMKN